MIFKKNKFQPIKEYERKTNIGIVGLGLIGGSIARGLKASGKYNIIGCDPDEKTLRYAFENNLIALGHTGVNILRGCDVIFICTPSNVTVEKAVEVFELIGNQCIITDVAGIKEDILKKLPSGIRFVGGHPMAGTEKSGIINSTPTMLQNAYYILTTDRAESGDVEKISEIAGDLGAIIIKCTASEHDKAVSKISHLPHAVSYCLADYGASTDLSATVAAGSFRDMTRVAKSPPEFWKDIFLLNPLNLCDDLDNLILRLENLKQSVQDKNENAILKILESGYKGRQKLKENKAKEVYSLNIDVADEPLVIANIARTLGKAGINISNIAIISARDRSGGALKIDIKGEQEYEKAKEILLKKKYNVD